MNGARTSELVPAALDLLTPRRQLHLDGSGGKGDDEDCVQQVRPTREILVVDVDRMVHDAVQEARHGDVERGHLERKGMAWRSGSARRGARQGGRWRCIERTLSKLQERESVILARVHPGRARH